MAYCSTDWVHLVQGLHALEREPVVALQGGLGPRSEEGVGRIVDVEEGVGHIVDVEEGVDDAAGIEAQVVAGVHDYDGLPN